MLDLGCGDGSVSRQFLPDLSQLTLLDLSFEMLAMARAHLPSFYRKKVHLINADFQERTLNQQYDIILCIGVLAHVSSIHGTISRAAELMRTGGKLVIQFTDAENLAGGFLHYYDKMYRQHATASRNYTLNSVTRSNIQCIIADCGLRLVAEERYIPLLPGFRRLPFGLALKMMEMSLNSAHLSNFQAEHLLLLQARRCAS